MHLHDQDPGLHDHEVKPSPWWKHIGTRLATKVQAARGRAQIRAAVKTLAPPPKTAVGKYNRKSATKLGWTLELLRRTFAFPAGSPTSWDDHVGFERIQRVLRVPFDGKFGAVSYEAMMRRYFAVDFIIVAGYPHPAPPGIRVHNWYKDGVTRFSSQDRRGRKVDMEVKHESVDDTAAGTVATLVRKRCGVHLMATELFERTNDGALPLVTQHGDLAWDRLTHAVGQNGTSVGLEGVSRYYGKKGQRPIIYGGWVHKGVYLVPSLEKLEASTIVTVWLTSGEIPGLSIPRRWTGLTKDGRLSMSRVKSADRAPGVSAHAYTDHADAAYFVLYAILRLECGLNPDAAYDAAMGLASTKKTTVDLDDHLPPDGEWKERAAA
jgi:hypothetical protein